MAGQSLSYRYSCGKRQPSDAATSLSSSFVFDTEPPSGKPKFPGFWVDTSYNLLIGPLLSYKQHRTPSIAITRHR